MKAKQKNPLKKPPKRNTTGSSNVLEPGNDPSIIPTAEIYCDDPYSFALLFRSEEISCIIQACDVLYEYMIKNPDVGEELVGKGIVDDILNGPSDNYPYYNGSRYRFLSKLYEMYPQTRRSMEMKLEFLRMAAIDAAMTEDVPLMAYALLYLSTVTKNVDITVLNEFIDKFNGIHLFFKKFLPESDVDVKCNTLGLMKNFLLYEKTTLDLIASPEFSFLHLVDQAGCPYPDIQNRALEVIMELTARKDTEDRVHSKFSRAGGFEILFQLLNVFEWKDIHAKVLKILRILFRNSNNFHKLTRLNGFVRLLNYVNFIMDDDLIEDVLGIIVEIASTNEGKMIIIKTDILNMLINVLNDGSQESKINACKGMQLLTEEPTGILELTRNNPSKLLTKLILDRDNTMALRCISARTLSALARTTPITVLKMSRPKIFSTLVKMLELPLELTVDCVASVMETILTILVSPPHLNSILSLELSKNVMALLFTLDCDKQKLAQCAAEILTRTLSHEIGREWFVALSGVTKVMKLLYTCKDPVLLNNIGLLLKMILEQDCEIMDDFIRAGLVKWLLENKKLWKESPRLETATETLFCLNLSLKLEFWGRLEMSDVTGDGFYCCRSECRGRFPLATDLARTDICYYRPSYLVCMGIDVSQKREDSLSLYETSVLYSERMYPEPPLESKFSSGIDHPDLSYYSRSLLKKAMEAKSRTFNDDTRLQILYQQLKEMMELLPTGSQSGRSKFTKDWMLQRVNLIAKAVVKAMSGQHHGVDCTYHTFELHIQELKKKLQTSLIPLGEVEVGMKLERALLFKVLADRLVLPCALARGEYSVAWVEVALPTGPDNFKDLPCEKLLTDHLVDLVDRPGRLIPLSTAEAANYCGRPLPGFLDRMPRHLSDANKPPWMDQCKEDDGKMEHVEIY